MSHQLFINLNFYFALLSGGLLWIFFNAMQYHEPKHHKVAIGVMFISTGCLYLSSYLGFLTLLIYK